MRSVRCVTCALLVSLALTSGAYAPAFAGSLVPAKAKDAGLSPEALERLTTALQAYVDSGKLAGSVTLVARNGKIGYLEAVGMRDREAEAPMRADTIFRIASQTKAVVSVAAMMLVEGGKLSLGDPVGKVLPEFRETTVAVPRAEGGFDEVAAERPITIHDLLTHTSGFGYGIGPGQSRWAAAGLQGWYFANKDETIGESVARMGSLPAQAHPGERWIYGYSSDILGAVVETVSGQPLDVFLRERVFEPLGMQDTAFYLPVEKRDRLAVVYARRGASLERGSAAGLWEGQGAYVEGPRKSLSGGAGLLSTASDYARFLQMLLDGGELDGRRILSTKSVERMTVNQLGDVSFSPGEGFGFGFAVVEYPAARGLPGSAGEYGWGGAYHTKYWVDPHADLIVVHLTQLLPAGDIDDERRVRELVYEAVLE